jgi:AraC-like DNA-binding protein
MLDSEDRRPGQLSTSTNDNHVHRVPAVIHGNHRLSVQEVADEVGISTGSCQQIFTEKLRMRRVSAKFVLHLLTEDQKKNRVEINQELLANANEHFLTNVITGDEMWVCGYDVENKMQSSQWMGKGSL